MNSPWPMWLAGRRESSSDVFDVRSPYDGAPVASVAYATAQQVDRAVAAAVAAAEPLSRLPAHVRAEALAQVASQVAARRAEFVELLCAEAGKPVKWAEVEVDRASSTFRWAAEEARRWSGSLQRLDTDVSGEGRLAMVRRFPRGPVLAIAPFNFPLNLVAHKVAPALAVGAPILVKPAPKTPLSALLLGELLAETDLPPGSWSVLPVPDARMPELVADPRLPVVSFTGSGPVGWRIRAAVPTKHVTLELGGNAAVLVASDWCSAADLDGAAARIATFSNYQAGQSCIAVQRVYVEQALYEPLLERLVERVRCLAVGDPRDPRTEVGPLIDEASARRVEEWVAEAVDGGARICVGGHREGTAYAPTVLVDVPVSARLHAAEVFGPVLFVEPVPSFDEGLARINDSEFGLQAGVLTRDVAKAFHAHATLRVGGVVIGDVPSYRADQMPYGGTKGSGIGREGPRSAMEDFTEERLLVLTGVTL